MKRCLLVTLLLVVCVAGYARKIRTGDLKNGDLLFQNLDCGPLCDAIEKVTIGYKGLAFSHIGLVVKQKDSIYVIEAIGKDVHLTPLRLFAGRSNHAVYVGRVKRKFRNIATNAVEFAKSKTGVTYDDAFLYNNGKYYCSELMYDAFMSANNGKPFFLLQPMTFCEPGTHTYFAAWIAYYKEIGFDIPEGQPGINPGGISLSPKLRMIGVLQ